MVVTPVPRAPAVSLTRAILAGFIASLALLVVFAFAYGIALVLARILPYDRPLVSTLAEWFRALTHNSLVDLALPNPFAAVVLFTIGGVFWALLYAFVFDSQLGGPEWRRGMLFALLPWAFSLCVFLPLVGGGFLGFGLGAGPLPIVGNLILHAVYGAVLARLYGPFGEVVDGEEQVASEVQLSALAYCESGAVRVVW